ncbi:MAG TPA: hypothetical protein VK627_10850 [Edaphobacter sp.]|nr:hypothetical protein [Edaphobacter sp.]
MDWHERDEVKRKMRANGGLRIPEESLRLHDVFWVCVQETPGENALKLGEGLFERDIDTMSGPEADEACIGMHIGVKDRRVEIDLCGHAWIVARKDDAQAMAANHLACSCRVRGRGEECRYTVDLKREAVVIPREPQPTRVGLLERFK